METAVLPCGFTAQPIDPAAGPAGDWTDAGVTSGFGKCTDECKNLQMNYAALLPKAEQQFQCWCSKSVDMSAYSTVMPEVGGHAQILDLTTVISRITSTRTVFQHVHVVGRR